VTLLANSARNNCISAASHSTGGGGGDGGEGNTQLTIPFTTWHGIQRGSKSITTKLFMYNCKLGAGGRVSG